MLKSNFLQNAITNFRTAIKVRKNQIYMVSILAVVLIAIGAIAVLNSPKPASPPTDSSGLTATLKETRGTVTSKQPDQKSFSDATPGQILQLGGQVQTGPSSTARLDLSSGTIIRLAPSSLFSLEANKEIPNGLATTLNLTLGQIFIILKGGSLDITVPSGVASVRGSYMSALIYPSSNEIFVECLEGLCAAKNNGGEVMLTNAQKAVLNYMGEGPNKLPQLTTMNHNDYLSWEAISPEATDLINQLKIDEHKIP
jgi:FecR protein